MAKRPKYFWKEFYVVLVNGHMYWHNVEEECGSLYGRLLQNVDMNTLIWFTEKQDAVDAFEEAKSYLKGVQFYTIKKVQLSFKEVEE